MPLQAAQEEGDSRLLPHDRVSFQVLTRIKAQQEGQAVGGVAAQHAGGPQAAVLAADWCWLVLDTPHAHHCMLQHSLSGARASLGSCCSEWHQ